MSWLIVDQLPEMNYYLGQHLITDILRPIGKSIGISFWAASKTSALLSSKTRS